MAKNLRKPKTGVKKSSSGGAAAVLWLRCGRVHLLLALAAFLLTHTGLPLSAVRPMACMAAAVGAAVSAAVLARRLRKKAAAVRAGLRGILRGLSVGGNAAGKRQTGLAGKQRHAAAGTAARGACWVVH